MIEPNVNDFFRAYATAMLVWQHVESALFSTFFSLYNYEEEPKIGSRNLKRLGAVFYSQETFSAKLKIVDALAKVTLAPELLTEWKKLKKQMERAYAHRNVLPLKVYALVRIRVPAGDVLQRLPHRNLDPDTVKNVVEAERPRSFLHGVEQFLLRGTVEHLRD